MDFYRIARAGVDVGEYDIITVRQYLALGNLKHTDHAWCQGMAGWKTLAELEHEWSTSPTAGLAPVETSVPQTDFESRGPAPESCPNCGSSQIRAARAIYLAETKESTGMTNSFGGSSYSSYGGTGRRSSSRTSFSHRTYSSRLAQELAPPEQQWGATPTSMKRLGYILLGIFGIGFFFIPTIFAIRKIRQLDASDDAKLEQEAFEKAKVDYEHTWYCQKCSRKFVQ